MAMNVSRSAEIKSAIEVQNTCGQHAFHVLVFGLLARGGWKDAAMHELRGAAFEGMTILKSRSDKRMMLVLPGHKVMNREKAGFRRRKAGDSVPADEFPADEPAAHG
jgi:hypothetical protein